MISFITSLELVRNAWMEPSRKGFELLHTKGFWIFALVGTLSVDKLQKTLFETSVALIKS